MNDETKAAVEWLRDLVVCPPGAEGSTQDARLLLAHIDAEPARLAAAREEQREACATECNGDYSCATAGLTSTPLADRIAELEARAAEWADAQRVFMAAEAERDALKKALTRLVNSMNYLVRTGRYAEGEEQNGNRADVEYARELAIETLKGYKEG